MCVGGAVGFGIVYFYFMCVCLHVCLCACDPGGPDRMLDPLELKLQMTVNHLVGAGNPRFSERAAILPAPDCF